MPHLYSAPPPTALFDRRLHQPRAALIIDSRRYVPQDVPGLGYNVGERTIANIAATVVEYVRKRTGATLPIVNVAATRLPADLLRVYLGRSRYVDRKVGQELDDVDPCGYIIRVADGRHLIIAGATSEGTEFGTFEFLERFVGVRWLFPTDVGDHVPRGSDLLVPAHLNLRDEPTFMQVPNVGSQPTHQAWARRMRFWTRLNFHHNLVKLFPPTEYTKTHPEFFPIPKAGGTERYLPTEDTEDWQPCFTAPGIVDEAARKIIAYFDANPRIRSYSFGVNDSHTYCQCENCRKEYLPGETFLGMPCYADAYFKFVNAVVEKVVKVHPDVWFGCLAYSNIGLPPVKAKVHPRVIPFLTYDTMQLLDPERRRNHEALVEAWGKQSTFLGRYDYTYGDDHVPPRLYLHHWADYVRWARDHQVRAWYAETYPFFGEGPKYYVMAKLWWNPDRDVDALLNEWYQLAFGRAAAPMKAYFDHWETYWTKRVPQGEHFERCKDYQWLLGGPEWLGELRSEDVAQAEGWIARAGQLADTPQTKARVAVMARSWEYYRAVMQTYMGLGQSGAALSVEDALTLLERVAVTASNPPRALHDRLMQDPVLVFTWTVSYPYDAPEQAPFLRAAETYLDTRDERLTAELRNFSQTAHSELSALASTFLAIGEGRAVNVVPNSGFEANNPLEGWWAGMHRGPGQCRVTEEEPWEGLRAVEVTGPPEAYGGVFRVDVPVKANTRYLFVLRARHEGQPDPATECQMLTQFADAQGRILSGSWSTGTFRCAADWGAAALETTAAPAAAAFLYLRVDAVKQPPGHRTCFDALEAYEVVSPKD